MPDSSHIPLSAEALDEAERRTLTAAMAEVRADPRSDIPREEIRAEIPSDIKALERQDVRHDIADQAEMSPKRAAPRDRSVSVIICTRNRSASLARTLECFFALDLPLTITIELLVVNNRSTDDTRDVVQHFAARAPFAVRLIDEDRAGLGYARNRGLRESVGEMILFTDDDCLVQRDWVDRAVVLLEEDALRVIGGRVDNHNPLHLRHAIRDTPDPEVLACPGQVFGYVHGANIALGREVVRRIGGFDVRFGAGTQLRGADDADFVYRAAKSGIPVLYDPTLRVRHDHGRSGARADHTVMHGYAVGVGGMLAKHVLDGDYTLVRSTYWDTMSAFRAWRQDRRKWPGALGRIGLIVGVARFLLHRGPGQPTEIS